MSDRLTSDSLTSDRPATRAGWEARVASLRIEGRAFIDGRLVSAASGRSFARLSPIHGRAVAEVAACEAVDVDRAVASARRAFEDGRWRDKAPVERKRVMLRSPR